MFGLSDSDSEEELMGMAAVISAAGIIVVGSSVTQRKCKERSMWVRPVFERRRSAGAYNLLMLELRQSSDTTLSSGFTRLSPDMFDSLLNLVEDMITGSNRLRMPIEPELKLAVTRRYLSTGRSRFYLVLLIKLTLYILFRTKLRNFPTSMFQSTPVNTYRTVFRIA